MDAVNYPHRRAKLGMFLSAQSYYTCLGVAVAIHRMHLLTLRAVSNVDPSEEVNAAEGVFEKYPK